MSSLSVNSASSSNYYLTTSIAQQKVASDRADILDTETQLDQEKAVLDKDLTYLGNAQRKTQTVQKLENTQAQTNAYDKVVKTAQVAKQATQQALSSLVASTTPDSALGTNINVFA
jgi:cyclophilin family peptidyl-prolyl cis-trans isomerase